ncbi:related to rRNA-processing protein efg1 [Rhynchosporium agropyri]|uniref:rRNA-processing protein EFG1 n=1 Tax=Rhynchosporium agropyri TaxID=914238 RepID=A0A1E1KZF8_9HELO|nr:related to rRNA-processing protein efg1 [Rhynchosporium agropyri]
MAPKRKHQETEPEEAVHPSRQFQVPGIPKPAKKPRKFEPPVYKKQAHASSVNAIKKRIRDVSRRLERSENAPADKKLEDERALIAYQQELADAEAEKIRQKMIKKYHMVRFFERRKAERQLKRLRKRLLETKSTEEVETLKAEMHIVEVDLNYTQYHPLSEAYISLYPNVSSAGGEEEETRGDTGKSKPPIWAEVEQAMEDGTLRKLRNRTSNAPVRVPMKPKMVDRKPARARARPEPVPVDITGLNRRERRKLLGVKDTRGKTNPKSNGASHATEADVGQDDDSDGGFFED